MLLHYQVTILISQKTQTYSSCKFFSWSMLWLKEVYCIEQACWNTLSADGDWTCFSPVEWPVPESCKAALPNRMLFWCCPGELPQQQPEVNTFIADNSLIHSWQRLLRRDLDSCHLPVQFLIVTIESQWSSSPRSHVAVLDWSTEWLDSSMKVWPKTVQLRKEGCLG